MCELQAHNLLQLNSPEPNNDRDERVHVVPVVRVDGRRGVSVCLDILPKHALMKSDEWPEYVRTCMLLHPEFHSLDNAVDFRCIFQFTHALGNDSNVICVKTWY
jgi:hypothetical protein